MTTIGSEAPLVGVGVAVVGNDGLLLIKRGREPQKGLWAIPGGKVRSGETMKEAARREAAEETGLDVEVGDVVWVGEVIDGDYHLVIIDFAARVVGGELRPGDDADDARWVPLDEVRDWPLTPTMFDLVDTLMS